MLISTVTESVHIIRTMLRAGSNVGVDPQIACDAISLDQSTLDDPDARIPMEKEVALRGVLAAHSGDDCFGLHAALALEAGEFDMMDYAIRTSSTFRQALQSDQRLNRLLHDVAEFELIDDGNTARFEHYFRNDPNGANWHAADFTLASVYAIGVGITGKNWAPQRVCFQHSEPLNLAAYKKVFPCPLKFDCAKNGLVFGSAVLDYPVIGGDPALNAVLIRHANDLLSKLPRYDSLVEQVRDLVAAGFRRGDPSIELVADHLHLTPRTLQRRLGASGTSFKIVVDEIRQGLTERYLRESQLGVSEIAYLLGYSEPSAFHRAFKRWFGGPPSGFRDVIRT